MSRKQNGARTNQSTPEFKIKKWGRCETELRLRQSVTLWTSDIVLTAWRAPLRTTPGGQGRYSSVVIELMVVLRQVFHLALRETECLMDKIMGLLALDLPIPDHTTISRRGTHLAAQRFRNLPDGPLHIILGRDSLKVYGLDEWPSEQKRNHATLAARVVKISVNPDHRTIVVAEGTSYEAVDIRAAPANAGSDISRVENDAAREDRSPPARVEAHPRHLIRTGPVDAPAIGTAVNPILVSKRQSPPGPERQPIAWKQGAARTAQELVRTWLNPPVRGGGLIDRRRLTGLTSEVRRNTLTFIKAPAGYGKSTLLSQWFDALSSEGEAVGWFSANNTDNDLSKFFRYIVAAIRESRPGFGGRIGLMLDSIDTFAMEALSSAFSNEVLEAADHIFLFLDDFHLISDPTIGAAMSFMLGQSPANLHLIIASRQSLPFDLSRLRMRGLLAEVGVDGLRFDQEDAANFLGLSGHKLSTDELQTVVAKTEGWAAGLQLASISLTQRKSDFFSLISGEQKEIAGFLAEDVMSHLPSETVDFMEKTSILARMNAALCATLTENGDAQGQIDLLERQSLFLFSLDDKRNWYRYHHLFANFLQRRLLDRDPALVSSLHSIASDWFAARGFFEEGVAHAIQAGDHVRAAGILEKGCSNLLYAGRPSMLIQWSRSIPSAVLREYPRLQLEIAWSIILEWGFADAERIILEAERKIEQLGAEYGQAWLDQMRKIVMHRKIMLYLFMDDMTNVEKEVLKGINTFPEDDPYLRGNLDTNLLYARRELYRLNEINQIDARAKDYYAKSGSIFVLVWHESIVGPTCFLKGETERAKHSLRTAMEIAEVIEGAGSALQAMPALLLAEVLYESNRCDQASELIAKYGAEAEKKGFLDHLAAFYTTRARLEMRVGAVDAARATLALGRISADRHGFERLHRRIEQEELRLAISLNDLSKARAVRDSGFGDEASLKPGPNTSSADETRVLTWSRACCAMGDAAKAARILRLWIAFVRNAGAIRSEVRFLIALTICLALSDRIAEASRCLREAVGKATGPRFVRCFLDEGEVVETLLQSLFNSSDSLTDPTSAFGQELLALFSKEPNYTGLTGSDDTFETHDLNGLAPPEVLNAREREVLAMAAAGLSNKEIARRLGLAEASIKWYMQQVFTKLDVRRRISAVRRAKQFGML